jgi:hypothetical protein
VKKNLAESSQKKSAVEERQGNWLEKSQKGGVQKEPDGGGGGWDWGGIVKCPGRCSKWSCRRREIVARRAMPGVFSVVERKLPMNHL